MICISRRQDGWSSRAIASHRSRRWQSRSSARMALASASVKFWMPCSVLKWYLTQTFLPAAFSHRSEEHTSELQSHLNLVCRLLLEKKKQVAEASPDPRAAQGNARPLS